MVNSGSRGRRHVGWTFAHSTNVTEQVSAPATAIDAGLSSESKPGSLRPGSSGLSGGTGNTWVHTSKWVHPVMSGRELVLHGKKRAVRGRQ